MINLSINGSERAAYHEALDGLAHAARQLARSIVVAAEAARRFDPAGVVDDPYAHAIIDEIRLVIFNALARAPGMAQVFGGPVRSVGEV